jgi:hypothetical protein
MATFRRGCPVHAYFATSINITESVRKLLRPKDCVVGRPVRNYLEAIHDFRKSDFLCDPVGVIFCCATHFSSQALRFSVRVIFAAGTGTVFAGGAAAGPLTLQVLR